MPRVVQARRTISSHYRPEYPDNPRDPNKARKRFNDIQPGEVLVLPDDYDKPIRQVYFRELRMSELEGAGDDLEALDGIGPKTKGHLHDVDIITVGDLATSEVSDLPEDIEPERIEQARAHLIPSV